jgi:6-phosphogluconolactonase
MLPKLLIGSYTGGLRQEGIYVYDFCINTARVTKLSSAVALNPSYLTVKGEYFFAVNEVKEGMVSAYRFDDSKCVITALNTQSSNGQYPCYLNLDRTGNWLLVGNYGSGSLVSYQLNADGKINVAHQTITHQGSSLNPKRQSGPHIHCAVTSVDNSSIFVVDLGLDQVVRYPFDGISGTVDVNNKEVLFAKPGSGPRHMVVSSGNAIAYLIEELSGNISVIKKQRDAYILSQSVNLIPDPGIVSGADIQLLEQEGLLFASQRSNHTIQVFIIEKKTGHLLPLAQHSALGLVPRSLGIHPSGKYLLVANQGSDEVVIFEINKITGDLRDTGQRVKVSNPSCLKWI